VLSAPSRGCPFVRQLQPEPSIREESGELKGRPDTGILGHCI
jgi:hypothetical protein